jgi:2-polyprenyl-3-methyl-5-hydroxy-6-metoxy-1,4-benzoquinol methylase
MDDPSLDVERHHRALGALARINRVSFAAGRVWRHVRELAAARSTPVRILDVACGGGDVLRELGRRATDERIDVELYGCDLSPVALAYAEDSLSRVPADAHRMRLFEQDVLADPLPGEYDVVVTSLFLHHLERADAVRLLRELGRAARARLLVQDLRRTRLGYAFAWVGLHTLTASDVARIDGLRSVRAAFTMEEVRSMAEEAGLGGATMEAVWPQRFALTWARA